MKSERLLFIYNRVQQHNIPSACVFINH